MSMTSRKYGSEGEQSNVHVDDVVSAHVPDAAVHHQDFADDADEKRGSGPEE
jgi:hypothetical protein